MSMSRGVLDVPYPGDDSSPDQNTPGAIKPAGSVEIIFRWLAFIPCALIAYYVAYHTIAAMGYGSWAKLVHNQSQLPSEPFLYCLLFHLLAAGAAGFMSVSLGALAAPAHRGAVGLVLLALLSLGVLVCAGAAWSRGGPGQVGWVLSGGVTAVWAGVYAMRGLVRVFGWRGAPLIPAIAYWRERPANQKKP